MGMGPYWFGTLPTCCSMGMRPFPMTCSTGMGFLWYGNETSPTCLEWKWWLYSPWVSLYLMLMVALLSLQLTSEMQSFHSREEIFSSGKRRRISTSSVICAW